MIWTLLIENSTSIWTQFTNDNIVNTFIIFFPILVMLAVIIEVLRHATRFDDSSSLDESDDEGKGEGYAREYLEEEKKDEEDEERYTCEYCGGFVHDVEGRCPICSAPRKEE